MLCSFNLEAAHHLFISFSNTAFSSKSHCLVKHNTALCKLICCYLKKKIVEVYNELAEVLISNDLYFYVLDENFASSFSQMCPRLLRSTMGV